GVCNSCNLGLNLQIILSDFFKEIFTWLPFDAELITLFVFIFYSNTLKNAESMAGIIIFVSWLLDVLSVAVSHSYASIWIFMTNPGNQWFYNLSMPIIILLYAILYYTLFDNRNVKRVSIYGSILFLILHFADLIWLQGTCVTDTYSIVAGQVFIGVLAFF